jgi:type I restriction enzyme S subunit
MRQTVSIENSNLPEGWFRTIIGSVAQYVNGRAFKPSEWENEGLPIIRIQNLNDANAQYNYSNRTFEERYKVVSGDLLFAWSASLGAHFWRRGDAWLNQHIFRVIPYSCVVKSYLYYSLKLLVAQLYSKAHGSGMVHVTRGKFLETELPLPPLPEQHRIVAKIEELFSDLDAGIASLKKAKEQLKTYRQSVLKWAFEGKLTEEWRTLRQAQGSLPDAKELLAQIKEEREKKYKEECEKAKKEGKRAPKKMKELPPIAEEELAELPVLPEGWEWVRNDSLLSFVTSGSRGWAKYYSDSGAIFLRMGNLDHRTIRLDLADVQYVDLPASVEGKRSLVQGNDLLISITADVGMVGLVPEGFPEAYINQHVAMARPLYGVLPHYLAWYLAGEENGQRLFKRLQRGATKVGLGLDDIRTVAIPFCSYNEQCAIQSEIETRISEADNLEKSINSSLAKSEFLRQSILKQAFSGKLVPQDPNDEPAEKLLERIKKVRTADGHGLKDGADLKKRGRKKKGG